MAAFLHAAYLITEKCNRLRDDTQMNLLSMSLYWRKTRGSCGDEIERNFELRIEYYSFRRLAIILGGEKSLSCFYIVSFLFAVK